MLFMIASCSDSPETKIIKEIEKSVKINDIQKYDRYYYIENDIAYGIYLITNREGRLFIVQKDKMTKILYGGCDVINATFDLNTENIQNVFCKESS